MESVSRVRGRTCALEQSVGLCTNTHVEKAAPLARSAKNHNANQEPGVPFCEVASS